MQPLSRFVQLRTFMLHCTNALPFRHPLQKTFPGRLWAALFLAKGDYADVAVSTGSVKATAPTVAIEDAAVAQGRPPIALFQLITRRLRQVGQAA
jgi:hypothetical protein